MKQWDTQQRARNGELAHLHWAQRFSHHEQVLMRQTGTHLEVATTASEDGMSLLHFRAHLMDYLRLEWTNLDILEAGMSAMQEQPYLKRCRR